MALLNTAGNLFYYGQDVKAVYQDGTRVWHNDLSLRHEPGWLMKMDLTESNAGTSDQMVYEVSLMLEAGQSYEVWMWGNQPNVIAGSKFKFDVWFADDRPPVRTHPSTTQRGEVHGDIVVNPATRVDQRALAWIQAVVTPGHAGPATLTVVAPLHAMSAQIAVVATTPTARRTQRADLNRTERKYVPRTSKSFRVYSTYDHWTTGHILHRDHSGWRDHSGSDPDQDEIGQPLTLSKWRNVTDRQGIDLMCNGRTRIMVAQSFHSSGPVQMMPNLVAYPDGATPANGFAWHTVNGATYSPPSVGAIRPSAQGRYHQSSLSGQPLKNGKFTRTDWIEIDHHGLVHLYLWMWIDAGSVIPDNNPGLLLYTGEYKGLLTTPEAYPATVWPVVHDIALNHPNALHVKVADTALPTGTNLTIDATLENGNHQVVKVPNPVDTTLYPSVGKFASVEINGKAADVVYPHLISGIRTGPTDKPVINEQWIVNANPTGIWSAYTPGSIALWDGTHWTAHYPHNGDTADSGGRRASFQAHQWTWDDDHSPLFSYPRIDVTAERNQSVTLHAGQPLRVTFPLRNRVDSVEFWALMDPNDHSTPAQPPHGFTTGEVTATHISGNWHGPAKLNNTDPPTKDFLGQQSPNQGVWEYRLTGVQSGQVWGLCRSAFWMDFGYVETIEVLVTIA